MGFTPRHFVTPLAAFTMAIAVTFYVKYSISTARAESKIRQAGELAHLKEMRQEQLANQRSGKGEGKDS